MTVAQAQPMTYAGDASWPRFTVAKYQRMIASGAFDDDDRLELLEGYLVLKMTHDPAHDGTIDLIAGAVAAALPAGWFARAQSAVTLSDSQPEPDIAVVRGTRRSYGQRHPGPADIGLIVEVANSSLRRDLADKTRIYARAGIVAYWVVDVEAGRIEVYTDPSGPTAAPAYATRITIAPPDAVPLSLDGVAVASIPAADLLL